jgi:hypothetical protein
MFPLKQDLIIMTYSLILQALDTLPNSSAKFSKPATRSLFKNHMCQIKFELRQITSKSLGS